MPRGGRRRAFVTSKEQVLQQGGHQGILRLDQGVLVGGGAYGCRSHSSHGRYSERVKSLPLQICFRDFSAAEKYASK